MPLGYKYAERNAPTEVDWYKVGKDMSDMLAETNRVREEKKDALDKAQRETLQALADTPNGTNASARQGALEYSNVATNNLKLQYDLMKSGRLNPKDFMIYRQNLNDSTDLLFNANKAYQENFAKIIQNVDAQNYSGATLNNAAEAEGFGDWNSNIYQVNPTGNVIVAKKEKKTIDGKDVWVPSNEPGKALSVNSINQLLLNPIPFPKTNEEIKAVVDRLGTEKDVIVNEAKYLKQGVVYTINDIKSRTDLGPDGKAELFKFVQFENDAIDTLLGNSQKTATILYDLKKTTTDNKPYDFTTDETKAKNDPSLILKVLNADTGAYEYKISDAQKKEGESYIRNQMRAQYDYEKTANVGSQLQELNVPAPRPTPPADKTPKVKGNELLSIITTNTKTKAKRLTGISQRLDNLRFEEAEGIENVITDIGYNDTDGTLEIKGYQVTGKETAGTAEDQNVTSVENGETITTPKTVKKGKNVAARKNLVSKNNKPMNDINNASLLSSVVTRMPNPEDDEGGNFTSVSQAKSYFRRQYEARANKKGVDYRTK